MNRKNKRKGQRIVRFEKGEMDFIIAREFPESTQEAKNKFSGLKEYGIDPDRIVAAILKLADGDFDKIKGLIKEANTDPRDVVGYAEYPRSMKISWAEKSEMSEEEKQEIYDRDWEEYQEWKNKGK